LRFLGLGLFAEGPRDERFLPPILHRAAEEMCRTRGRSVVEVGRVEILRAGPEAGERDRATRILDAARGAGRAVDLLFVHADGAGNPAAARARQVEPSARLIAGDPSTQRIRVIAVVPVRETEAWALADGDALRAAFGSALDDADLGVPHRALDVEGLMDPKRALEDAHQKVLRRRRRRKDGAARFLEAIAERVRLPRLREVPAFAEFERALEAGLSGLGYLER
jgi:hypothetical protein